MFNKNAQKEHPKQKEKLIDNMDKDGRKQHTALCVIAHSCLASEGPLEAQHCT